MKTKDRIPVNSPRAILTACITTPDPREDRRQWTWEEVGKLADSIQKVGLVHAITVCWNNATHSYVVVCGVRRLLACRILGMKRITCHVVSQKQADDMMALYVLPAHNVRAVQNTVEGRGPVYWSGMRPDSCDICGAELKDEFLDAKCRGGGPWAIMCPNCHVKHGCGIVTVVGQRYKLISGRFTKVEG